MTSEIPSQRRRPVAALVDTRSALRRTALTFVAAVLVGGAMPAAAWAYWDFTGNLSPGASYGEAQAGTSGYWRIRVSRSNCNADAWERRRSDGYWIWDGAPCSYSDYTDSYPLSTYDASHAKNTGSSVVWVNVRIDATT
jgi:hypothetical protein